MHTYAQIVLVHHLSGLGFIAYVAEARRHAVVGVIAHLDMLPVDCDSGLTIEEC